MSNIAHKTGFILSEMQGSFVNIAQKSEIHDLGLQDIFFLQI